MTTSTQQNTVFSVPVIVVERCETGKRMMKEWAAKIQAADINSWWNIFGKGYIPYKKHRLECVQCTNFDFRLLPVVGWEKEK